MQIVVISDTHDLEFHERGKLALPDGDLLIHCGDGTMHGKLGETKRFIEWMAAQPHRHKIFVPGNHDFLFDGDIARDAAEATIKAMERTGCYVLMGGVAAKDLVTIGGLRFWGTPYQPEFMNWAFNKSEVWRRSHWAGMPNGIHVLVTHTPPFGVLDEVISYRRVASGPKREAVKHIKFSEHVGCGPMRAMVNEMKPLLHVFGHIHEEYGTVKEGATLFANCSNASRGYVLDNPPKVFEVSPEGAIELASP